MQHGFRFFFSLGCRQAVRHGTLTPACVGSNPANPTSSSRTSVRATPPVERPGVSSSLRRSSPPHGIPLRSLPRGTPFVYLDCAPFKKPGLCPGFSHTAPSFLLFPTKLCFANFRGGPGPAGLFVYAARNPHQPAACGRKAAGFHFSVTSWGHRRDKIKTIYTDLSFYKKGEADHGSAGAMRTLAPGG